MEILRMVHSTSSATRFLTRRLAIRAGILLGTGFLCWLVGGIRFLTTLEELFGRSELSLQHSLVHTLPATWGLQQLLFLLGTVATAFGLSTLARLMQLSRGQRLANLGRLAMYNATVMWFGLALLLLVAPYLGEKGGLDAVRLELPFLTLLLWHGANKLMLVSFLFFGMGMLQDPKSRWLGGVISGVCVVWVACLLLSLHQPVALYHLSVVVGAWLYLRRNESLLFLPS
jgi:hypothetical protein